MSSQLESDVFKDTLQEKAKDAGVEDVVATIQIESVAVAEEVQVATQTTAAVSFQLTVTIPVQNFAEVDPSAIELLVGALNNILQSVVCVSVIIIL